MKTPNNSGNTSEPSRDLIRGKALRFLGRREYSETELQKKLLEKFPEGASFVSEVIEEFKKQNWVSDIRYASEFVREKSEYGGWGPMKISQKLKEKGIEGDIINSALEEGFSEDQQRELAQQLAEEKWRLLHKKTAPLRKAAVQRFLMSRGFSFPVVLDVTNSLS